MINELLRDLINTGRVAAFIDDMIVGTEGEEGHDELVVEVVKRLVENDLYVKTGEVQVESERSRVFRSNNQARENKDGEREGEECLDWLIPKYIKDV